MDLRFTDTFVQELQKLSSEEREELRQALDSLLKDPLPRRSSGVQRLPVPQSLNFQSLFGSRTKRFVIYHTVSDDDVIVLSLVRRPGSLAMRARDAAAR